jgi:hypothetical protein
MTTFSAQLDDSTLDSISGGHRKHDSGYYVPDFVFQSNSSDISDNVFQNNGGVAITVTQTNSNDRR